MNYLNIFSYLLITGCLFSSSVSIYNAEAVARNLYRMRQAVHSQNELNVTSVDVLKEDSNELIYLFHLEPEGFIMIAADDRSTPILAYSFENLFKLDGMPPNLSWVIKQYKNNIQYVITSDVHANTFITTQWYKLLNEDALERQQGNVVAPLITAEFDQGGNWNNECPPGCENQEALVGCVAVSMSQIMHYWKYPLRGQGENTYLDPEGDESSFGTLFVDFDNSIYDYSSMGDGTSSSEAASLLLYDAGVSVEMDYGCGESGAIVSEYINEKPSAEYALKIYFKYEQDLTSYSKDGFNEYEFIDIIKEELDNHRPFIWSGFEGSGNGALVNGHAWVCDGYNEEDLFHMNWGWGGDNNGYYSVDMLNPSGYKFDISNSVLLGIQPPDGAIVSPRLMLESYNAYELSGDHDEIINPGETVGLEIEILNSPAWHDASSIELELSSDESGISMGEGISTINGLSSGQTFTNTDVPFILNIDPNAVLGKKELILKVSAIGLEGEQNNSFLHEYEVDINVSLNQHGFPVNNITVLNASPLIIDLDDDGNNEIIIGDNFGIIHVFNIDGTEVQNGIFPFDTGQDDNNNKIWGSAAAADLDNDGLIDFVITSYSQHLHIFDKNGLKADFDSGQRLMGTPAIGNLDDDDELEIVFSGYSSNNKIFVVNSDGTEVSGFPYELGEKVKAGVALADFNGNGKDDIVLGTDDSFIHLIYDDGSEAPGFPYQVGNKIQIAPSILDINGDKVIFSGSGYNIGTTDNNFYAINSDGSPRFLIEVNKTIVTSPSFLSHNENLYIFFGANDSLIYAVDTNGDALNGWPVNAGVPITKSIVFSDLDCNGEVEIIAANEASEIVAYNIDGTPHAGFPINGSTAFTGSPIIVDLDNDGDLEILVGAANHLTCIDIKSVGSDTSYWNMYRGNLRRTGYSGTAPIGGYIAVCPEQLSNITSFLPSGYKLNPLYPNPFNPITTISYTIQNLDNVKIVAYDIRGRLVDNIISEFQTPGYHSVKWDASFNPSGVYFITMESGIFQETRKVLLIK